MLVQSSAAQPGSALAKHCPTWRLFLRSPASPSPERTKHRFVRVQPRCKGKKSEIVVGIDLGTTNSAVAVIENGHPVIVPDKSGCGIVPSVVAFQKNGTVVVGEQAKRQGALQPLHTFYSVKRFIGQQYEDVKKLAKKVAYDVQQDEEGAVVLKSKFEESGYLYPEQVSAYVLQHLLDNVVHHTGRTAKKAVITVPAYFNNEQREATITAGKIAGLETVRLIREPVAAALGYGLDRTDDHCILVFDLGGGTFDVSILEVGSGVIEVLATGGDMELGGDDWDDVIVQMLLDDYIIPSGHDISHPVLRSSLKSIAEAAKCELSSSQAVNITMPIGGPNGQSVTAALTRQRFESLSAELYRRARLPVEEACMQAGISLAMATGEARKKGGKRGSGSILQPTSRPPIKEVLLVGGATRMPGVSRFLRNMTGVQPRKLVVDPDEAVALGAAVQAGLLEGEVRELMVMDVWQAALMRAFATHKLMNDPAAAQQYLHLDNEFQDEG